LIYKQTKNLRAVQVFLGHTKLESTVHYLGIEVGDALELSESIDIKIVYNSGNMDASYQLADLNQSSKLGRFMLTQIR
jgi:hypothetical protein